MPFTIYHLGFPVLIFGLASWKKTNWDSWKDHWEIVVGISVGSVVPDIGGFAALFLGFNIPLHGFSHTLVGALVYAFGLSLITSTVSKRAKINLFEYQGAYTFVSLFVSLSSGIAFLHLLPDVFIYADMEIFWPFSNYSPGNLENYTNIALILSLAFLMGMISFGLRYIFLFYQKRTD